MKARRIAITDTTLRDAHQSLWATRMRIGHIVPILSIMDQVGFHSLECWGGATFDTCLRFLEENPWERLRTIKHHVRHTPLQMLLRGQNLVGYRHYGDDIVRAFVRQAADSGVGIFRVFDALNDTRNIRTAGEAIKETGKHFQGAVVYTISPVHTLEHYVEVAHELANMGADSICIKDMAALLSPYFADRLVQRLKEEIDLPLQLHCHYIGGLAPMTYLKAIEAGVDIVDTATVPLAFGASQPATEMVVTALKGTPYDTELDLELLFEIAEYFERVREEGGYERAVTSLDHMRVYSHQVPGGMISNLESQLKEQKAEERLREVLSEIPRVRAEVGYPPLVTPMSQIVGTQAVINVLTGKRWQVVPDEMKAYFRGKYGRPPGPINPDLLKRVLGGHEPITVRPADLITETVEEYRAEIGPLARSEEDVLTYALFPNAARGYFEQRHRGAEQDVFMTGPASDAASTGPVISTDRVRELVALVEAANVDEISVEDAGTKITVRKSGTTRPLVNAVAPVAGVQAAAEPAVVAGSAAEAGCVEYADAAQSNGGFRVVAPMVGTFYAASSPGAAPFVAVGQRVKEGDVLCILEAMKLMNEVASEVTGVVRAVLVTDGSPVEYGQPLFSVDLDPA
ncbi:MAG: acetyl-CoA carboxylase biotin carboxyl carrier protein [Actinobacteria bacterium]|nr:acetyl-CoA carboxylase biotin carboxyl carrier protein [Actinomycetota bacterium]